jgi:glycosyltransferase involved in cell wall biosynthesis
VSRNVDRIARVAVIVPAHNEEELLPGCLRAIHQAVRAAQVPTEILVVADACNDTTERLLRAPVAAAAPRHTVVTVRAGNVGVARAAGSAAAIAPAGPGGLWLLHTDADTLVPADWIVRHLAHAGRADLVAGTVQATDWLAWTPELADTYRQGYARRVHRGGHGHIHGANLGIRADAYLAVGGFQALRTGEDVALVHAARAGGKRVVTAIDVTVRTSTRPVARAPHGFSGHLHLLARVGAPSGSLHPAR